MKAPIRTPVPVTDEVWYRKIAARLATMWQMYSEDNQKRLVTGKIDWVLFWVVCVLIMVGVVMVFSTTIALPDSKRFMRYSSSHFFVRHLFAVGLGGIAMWFTMQIPVSFWQKHSRTLFAIAIVLLILVLFPFIGKTVFGARRWIPLGIFNLQPSEVMKLAVVVYSADFVSRKLHSMQSFSQAFLPMGILMVVVALLLLYQPDLGAFLLIGTIAASMLFLGGANGKIFALMAVAFVAVMAILIATTDYRSQRVVAFLNPWDKAVATDKGYQLTHALIAVARGEYWGVGVGGSLEKLHYLPEPHTDFIFAVMAEELGWITLTVFVALYYLMIYRIYNIGSEAITFSRVFQGLMAKGIALWLGLQGVVNMCVNVGILPTKGLTLPLVSYGGSGIIMNLIAIAIALRVDYENRQMMRGKIRS